MLLRHMEQTVVALMIFVVAAIVFISIGLTGGLAFLTGDLFERLMVDDFVSTLIIRLVGFGAALSALLAAISAKVKVK